MARHRPEIILLAAARVGGIHANHTYPAEFLFENLAIAANKDRHRKGPAHLVTAAHGALISAVSIKNFIALALLRR